jgi:hypothetical protein
VPLQSGKTTVLFDLANATPTPEGVQRFARKWGLLHRYPKDMAPEIEVSQFSRKSAELRGYLHLLSAGRWSEVREKVKGIAVPAGRRRFDQDGASTYFEPRSLLEFCYQELLTRLSHTG